MLTEKQKKLKKELEKEIKELDVLIAECKSKNYSDSVMKLLMSGKILKRDRLNDIKRYDR